MTLRNIYDQSLFTILDTFYATYDDDETVGDAENAAPKRG